MRSLTSPMMSTSRTNGRRNNSNPRTMSPPDLTFIFAEDVVEWDAYLSRQFDGTGTTIHHEQVEKMAFPLATSKLATFGDARVVLVILSPALLAFLDSHAYDCFQFMKLVKPGKTIAMLCGVTPSSVDGVKDVLVSFDEWLHLEAKDKDINMVRNAMDVIQKMLVRSRENERINKPKFKLVPRKVQEGNGKVYVILAKPLETNSKVRISLEGKGVKDVPVKKRNPFTLVFVIPDSFMQAMTMVNVHVWCDEDLLGVSQVKCSSKLGELFGLLSNVTSPYEFLCNTLGLATLHDVDSHLTSLFLKNMPKTGFELLEPGTDYERRDAKDEFPTLLHFAARHGLCDLVRELLQCPGADIASTLKNARGLAPAQLANHAGHIEVACVIDDYLQSDRKRASKVSEQLVICPQIIPESKRKLSCPSDNYDIPSYPVPVLQVATPHMDNIPEKKDDEYLKMKGWHNENIEPQQIFLDIEDKKDNSDDILHKANGNFNIPSDKENFHADKTELTLLESQNKLIEIMEAYKKGATLTDVEKLHNEWKLHYQVSDAEARNTLEGLRTLYAKAQKAKLSKKHSTSFSELRQFLNKLRRKESIGTKGNLSRKSSKENCSTDKPCTETDAPRPVSTLSVLSNTSTSSGSSFDRLSTASAGSDSGHHSDFCEDKNSKLKERIESRTHQLPRVANGCNSIVGFQKNFQCLTLGSKPPAPPPRVPKPVSRYENIDAVKFSEVPHYAVARKQSSDGRKGFDTIQEDIKISKAFEQVKKSTRNNSLSSIVIPPYGEDPISNYDCPPPPRPNCPVSTKSSNHPFKMTKSVSISCSPLQDYDLVPPPLPLSSPPKKADSFESYDIPKSRQRSNSLSMDYDSPKSLLGDNTDSLPSCTCDKNDSKFVKSCCMGNKLLMSRQKCTVLPSVPSSDLEDCNDIDKKKNGANQYYNLCLSPTKDSEKRNSMPDEIAPPPPVEGESPEEHYKLVGLPVPVPITN